MVLSLDFTPRGAQFYLIEEAHITHPLLLGIGLKFTWVDIHHKIGDWLSCITTYFTLINTMVDFTWPRVKFWSVSYEWVWSGKRWVASGISCCQCGSDIVTK